MSVEDYNTILENSGEYFKTPNVLNETHKEYLNEKSNKEREKDALLEKQKQEEAIHKVVKVIMRQTDYNEEQARESFLRNKTLEKCIEEYLGTRKLPETKPVSTNQAIYKSIREWMN